MVHLYPTACYTVGYGSVSGRADSDLISPSIPAGPSLTTASLLSIPGLLELVVALAILIIFFILGKKKTQLFFFGYKPHIIQFIHLK